MAHWGGYAQWERYLSEPWLMDADNKKQGGVEWLEELINPALPDWQDKAESYWTDFSWFSIIQDLMEYEDYPNVYVDISYTLYQEDCYPLLKVLLDNNPKVADRVLFGTDYFVVAQQGTERQLSLKLRGYLGEENYRKIAEENPRRFLNLDGAA